MHLIIVCEETVHIFEPQRLACFRQACTRVCRYYEARVLHTQSRSHRQHRDTLLLRVKPIAVNRPARGQEKALRLFTRLLLAKRLRHLDWGHEAAVLEPLVHKLEEIIFDLGLSADVTLLVQRHHAFFALASGPGIMVFGVRVARSMWCH